MRLLPLLLLVACVPVPPSGDVLAPVLDVAPTAAPPGPAPAPAPGSGDGAPPAPKPTGPGGGFDFEGEDRAEEDLDRAEEGPDGEAEDPLALQARLLGLDEVPKAAPAPAPPTAAPGPPAPIWDPSYPLPDASFGVRVLAVLLDMQPPRAVLGLPDGREQVVTPGAMLPAEGLIVLAIGRDAVQVAKITPSGFYARVDTETVRALYPQPTTQP